MPGFNKNEWTHFLNGGTTNYNFSYHSKNNHTLQPLQAAAPPVSAPIPASSPNFTIKKTTEKVIIPTIKGGKRKYRRRNNKSKSTVKK
jgi:hypothetical protein